MQNVRCALADTSAFGFLDSRPPVAVDFLDQGRVLNI